MAVSSLKSQGFTGTTCVITDKEFKPPKSCEKHTISKGSKSYDTSFHITARRIIVLHSWSSLTFNFIFFLVVASWHSSVAFKTEEDFSGHLMCWKSSGFGNKMMASLAEASELLTFPSFSPRKLIQLFTQRLRDGEKAVLGWPKWHKAKKKTTRKARVCRWEFCWRICFKILKLLYSIVKHQTCLLYDTKNSTILPMDFRDLSSLSVFSEPDYFLVEFRCKTTCSSMTGILRLQSD